MNIASAFININLNTVISHFIKNADVAALQTFKQWENDFIISGEQRREKKKSANKSTLSLS